MSSESDLHGFEFVRSILSQAKQIWKEYVNATLLWMGTLMPGPQQHYRLRHQLRTCFFDIIGQSVTFRNLFVEGGASRPDVHGPSTTNS